MQLKLKVIYFDVGGVLLHFYHVRDQTAVRLGVDPEDFHTLMRSVEIGRCDGSISEQEVERRICERFKVTQPPGFWADVAWVENFKPISEMHALAAELTQHYRVGVLSNVSREVYLKVRSVPGLWPEIEFDPLVLSFEVGLAKPDPRIFEHAVALAGCDPTEILFIDDKAVNVAAAQEVGLQTFLFNPAQVEDGVKRLKTLLFENNAD